MPAAYRGEDWSMISNVRVQALNGYGVQQEYSVDLWQGVTMPSQAYVVPTDGGPRDDRPIRKGTKVYERVIAAARLKYRREHEPD
jgi:hypothetical protein